MNLLKQNTAATVLLGPMVDWRDGKTLLSETPALTDLVCTLYKNGVAEAIDLSGIFSVDAHGMGLLTVSGDETDTLGRLDISLHNAVVDGYPSEIILPRVWSGCVLAAAGYSVVMQGILTLDLDDVMSALEEIPVYPGKVSIG